MKTELTHARLKELLHYDPKTGVFTWRKSRRTCRVGTEAGSINSAGYRQVGIDHVDYLLHRLAVMYMTGSWPESVVDHINGARADNRWVNLRPCSQQDNMQNVAGAHSDNVSGLLGVTFRKESGRYMSRIRVNGKSQGLGTYATAEEAHAAYRQAKVTLHTHHERLLSTT